MMQDDKIWWDDWILLWGAIGELCNPSLLVYAHS